MTKEELLRLALHCNRCGTCRGVTQDAVPDPAFSTQCLPGMTFFGAYEPAGLMYLARGIASGVIKWDKTIAHYLFSCTLCGYCEDLCSRGYRHTPALTILEELRREIPEELKPKELQKATRFLKLPAGSNLSLLKKWGLTDLCEGGSAETIIFIDRFLLQSSRKLDELGFLISLSGRRVGYFGRRPLPPVDTALINCGSRDVLEKSIHEIDFHLNAQRIKQVICYHPESLSILKRKSKSGAEFIHVTQFYAKLLKKRKVKRLKLPRVTYQDPCHLGRYAKIYTSPREVIEFLGLDLREMWRTRSNSLCCGAGGGIPLFDTKLAKRYALNRINEAQATGAEIIITACPGCFSNLQQVNSNLIQILDLTTLMVQAFGYKKK